MPWNLWHTTKWVTILDPIGAPCILVGHGVKKVDHSLKQRGFGAIMRIKAFGQFLRMIGTYQNGLIISKVREGVDLDDSQMIHPNLE